MEFELFAELEGDLKGRGHLTTNNSKYMVDNYHNWGGPLQKGGKGAKQTWKRQGRGLASREKAYDILPKA